MSHLLGTASAAICFLTMFKIMFVVVFVLHGIYIRIAHHIRHPIDTLACCVGFLSQIPPQEAILIGQHPYNGKKKKKKQQKHKVICQYDLEELEDKTNAGQK